MHCYIATAIIFGLFSNGSPCTNFENSCQTFEIFILCLNVHSIEYICLSFLWNQTESSKILQEEDDGRAKKKLPKCFCYPDHFLWWNAICLTTYVLPNCKSPMASRLVLEAEKKVLNCVTLLWCTKVKWQHCSNIDRYQSWNFIELWKVFGFVITIKEAILSLKRVKFPFSRYETIPMRNILFMTYAR